MGDMLAGVTANIKRNQRLAPPETRKEGWQNPRASTIPGPTAAALPAHEKEPKGTVLQKRQIIDCSHGATKIDAGHFEVRMFKTFCWLFVTRSESV